MRNETFLPRRCTAIPATATRRVGDPAYTVFTTHSCRPGALTGRMAPRSLMLSASTADAEVMTLLAAYVAEHYASPLRMVDLARHCHVSVRTLENRAFGCRNCIVRSTAGLGHRCVSTTSTAASPDRWRTAICFSRCTVARCVSTKTLAATSARGSRLSLISCAAPKCWASARNGDAE